MDVRRNKEYDNKNDKRKGTVIPMSALKELARDQIKPQSSPQKKSKREIASEIADEVGIYGKAFGRTMREHHKQGR
jgi:hypothetical protein